MPIRVKYSSWLLCAVALSAVAAQQVNAQPPSAERHTPSKVGGVAVADVLQRLGAKLERGADSNELDGYARQFDRADPDRDGKHTREEYVDKGGYMTPQARAGIFRAADGNADGVVTKAEYILNRIITDEAKAIVQGMDDEKDGSVERAEFLKHSTNLFSDRELAERVFAALDGNADGRILIPEYLRVWGRWARAGRKSAEDRIAVRRTELADVAKKPSDDHASSNERPGGFSPFGGPGGVRPGQAGLGRLAASGLEIGKPFPSIKIVDADGKAFSTEQLKGHYTVLIAGCLTCPAFLGTYPGIEAIHRDYASTGISKGVKFFYVYRALAHPENNGIVKPFSLEERLMHVADARTRLKTHVPWLADNMNNEFKRAIGNTNNSEFVLDPQGRIVHMQMWSNPGRLRAVLEEHVGRVEKPTTIADLELPSFRMRPNSPGSVLPRIKVPGIMVPLMIEPKDNGQLFYVKLRAEAEPSVLENGSGAFYLGFHIDPIHNTHWNNLVDPLHFEIRTPSGTKATPSSGDGPSLDVDTDSDPREFLVRIKNANPDAPLSLTVRYFACSDDPAWCKPVEQEYVVHFARDEFGGAVFGRTFRPPGLGRNVTGGRPGESPSGRREFGPPAFGGPPPFGGPGRGGPGAGPPSRFSVERLFRFDRDNDGKVSKQELPGFLAERLLGRADTNKDGVIDRQEAEQFGRQLDTRR